MLSVLKNFVVSLFTGKGNDECFDVDVRVKELLNEISSKEQTENGQLESDVKKEDVEKAEAFGSSDPVQYDVLTYKCIHKQGTVTQVGENFGVIDHDKYFDLGKTKARVKLKVGNRVNYSTFKTDNYGTEKVYRIYEVRDRWECGNEEDQGEIVALGDPDEKVDELAAIRKVLNGRVVKRRKRDLFIEPMNVWCSLDDVDASYVPVLGDWVSMEATVTLDKNEIDLSGEILNIASLKPLITKTGLGRISLWSDLKGEGAIENHIYFTKPFCKPGYIPKLGEEVNYTAIESDQGEYRWRALKVNPTEVDVSQYFVNNHQFQQLRRDKNDVRISPAICSINLMLHETKDLNLEIHNHGKYERTLKCIRFPCGPRSQLTHPPEPLENKQLAPGKCVQVSIRVRGTCLGVSDEVCVFDFGDFMIGRNVGITVSGNKEMSKLLPCKVETVFIESADIPSHSENYELFDREWTSTGPKPWRKPKFVLGEKMGHYKIPEKLWKAVMGTGDEDKSRAKAAVDLESCAPYLKEKLNATNYTDKLHTLLYLEEIELKRNVRKYDLKGVYLSRKGSYLTLEVPGLLDGRPSLVVGDKIILTQPWSEQKRATQVGYIYEIHLKEIYVKFHDSFHAHYDQSVSDVVFAPSTGSLMRGHDAINRAMRKLGPKWLFPAAVDAKPPQVQILVDGEDEGLAYEDETGTDMNSFECDIDDEGYVIPREDPNRKKLVWFNEKLNERQKQAVVSILRGHGRPLPYIILGPPGTGKTSTLVEVIMQLYHLMPESRVLVTAPSNSAADLICDRLIELASFKPGQLVRLVAYHRVTENQIPLKLVPYCTLVDMRDEKKPASGGSNGYIRSSSCKQLVGRHRITVGTCTCVGLLHHLALPPGHFTHILVDEAGQATEPELLISASFLNRTNGQIVLVGDPQQLGPVCFSPFALSYGLGESLMQRLINTFPYDRDFEAYADTSGYDPRFLTKLIVNYRSVPEILVLPSRMFYDSELVATVSPTEGYEADLIEKFREKLEAEKPTAIIFHGVIGQNYRESDTPSWFNPHEAWETVTYLRKLYEIGLKANDVGILTPYTKQVQKIRYMLNQLRLAQPKIGTVEDFQGQERYAIIVSLVRSNPTFISHDLRYTLGFVSCPRRLNVAITRARALLIIIADPLVLSRDPYWKTVVEHCIKTGKCTGCNLSFMPKQESESKDGEQVNVAGSYNQTQLTCH